MRKRRADRRLRLDLLHLAGLSAFALTEPIYRLIGANPQFLAAHAANGWQLALLVVVLSLLLPSLLAIVELASLALGERARVVVHQTLIGLLTAVFALQLLGRVFPAIATGPVLVAAAVAVGAVFVLAYRRYAAVYGFATFLALTAVVSPLAFLLDSRTREFLRTPVEPDVLAVEVARPAPLILMIFDELPLVALLDDRGSIDASLFPSFARVARMAHWFRGATTTGSYTEGAVPALHTGTYSRRDRLLPATLVNYPHNLFTLLGATYQVRAIETTTRLLPAKLEREATAAWGGRPAGPLLLLADVGAVALHVVTPPPWDARLPRLDAGWTGFWRQSTEDDGAAGKRDRITELRAFMSGLEPGPRPPFVYLHPLLPHVPWEYLPSGRRYFDGPIVPGLSRGAIWSRDEWHEAQAYQRARVQLQAVDRMLGYFLDRLQSLGWLDDSLLVLTSDHGAAFTPDAARRDLPAERREILRAEIMPILLLMKLPGQRDGVVHDERAQTIDVLPTIAEVLEVDIPWPIDGTSLFDPARDPARPLQVQLINPYATVFFEDDEPHALGELAQQRNRWFGRTEEGAMDLFRLGPYSDLVGQRAIATAATSAAPGKALIRDEHLFRDIAASSELLPALVRGEIELPAGEEPRPATPIAIAVNGIVSATTRASIDDEGAFTFAALLPEEALRPGSNTVEVFLVDRAEGRAAVLTKLESLGLQETLRATWTASTDTLLAADAATGWAGFRGSGGTTLGRGDGDALAISAAGGVPFLELPGFDARGADGFIVAIETECDDPVTPRFYYTRAADPGFPLHHYAQGRASAGRHVTFVEIRDDDLLGKLKLDLGRTRSRILLHSIAVRRAGEER